MGHGMPKGLGKVIAVIFALFCTIGYLIVTIIVLIGNASNIPSTIALIFSSAFSPRAAFGGMLGAAFFYPPSRRFTSTIWTSARPALRIPILTPQKLGSNNCDVWMDLNKDRIAADRTNEP